MKPLVAFRGVSKYFGRERALSGIDLAVARAAFTVLLGPSGCGKSTILRLVVGLERASEGIVEFDGKTIIPQNVLQVRRRLGYVIQDGGLFPHLTARSNIALPARNLRQKPEQIRIRLAELTALTRFPEAALDRYPVELSGGQRQRVSLMRALVLAPELLLLDEPFGALDPLVRIDLQHELKTICAQLHQTVVLVTHDLAEAAALGDKIVLLQNGQIVQTGEFEALRNQPATPFVRDFFAAQRGVA